MKFIDIRFFLAYLLVLVLTIFPLPNVFCGIRPSFVLLLVLYMQFYVPMAFNIAIIFLLGLFLDALLFTVMGEHAFALLLATWVANNKGRRFNFFPMGQQMALIGFFCLIYELTLFSINGFLGYHISFITLLGNVLTSAIIWPWMRLLAQDTLLKRIDYRS